jgi:hypothetical protein
VPAKSAVAASAPAGRAPRSSRHSGPGAMPQSATLPARATLAAGYTLVTGPGGPPRVAGGARVARETARRGPEAARRRATGAPSSGSGAATRTTSCVLALESVLSAAELCEAREIRKRANERESVCV